MPNTLSGGCESGVPTGAAQRWRGPVPYRGDQGREELDVPRPEKWAPDPVFEKRKERGIPTFKEAAAKVYAATYKTWRNL